MAVEIADDATHEQIQEAVDKIFDDRAGEEEASDSARVAADSDQTTAQREDTAGDEGEPPPDSDSGEVEPGDAWLTDDLRSEAAAVGIDEKDLAEFASREELDRAMKILNRQIDAERGADGKGKQQPEAKPEPETEAGYEVKLDKDVYDDQIVDEFTRMRDHYEARLAALEERFQTADDAAAEERFDRGVDALEFSQLFGKTGEETDTQMERRKELFERVQVEQEVLTRMGRNVRDYNALVQRVARASFPDDYEKRTIKNHTRKVSRQSEMRQGGSATRATGDPPPDWRDEVVEHYKELEKSG